MTKSTEAVTLPSDNFLTLSKARGGVITFLIGKPARNEFYAG